MRQHVRIRFETELVLTCARCLLFWWRVRRLLKVDTPCYTSTVSVHSTSPNHHAPFWKIGKQDSRTLKKKSPQTVFFPFVFPPSLSEKIWILWVGKKINIFSFMWMRRGNFYFFFITRISVVLDKLPFLLFPSNMLELHWDLLSLRVFSFMLSGLTRPEGITPVKDLRKPSPFGLMIVWVLDRRVSKFCSWPWENRS
jgi:hypothetical protein